MKRNPHTEATKARMRARALAHWADPSARAVQAEKVRARMSDPAIRVKISQRTRLAMTDPDVRARAARRDADPARRQRISDATKAALADPEVRKRISDATEAGMAARAQKQQAALEALWRNCSKAVRERFLDQLAREGGWPARTEPEFR